MLCWITLNRGFSAQPIYANAKESLHKIVAALCLHKVIGGVRGDASGDADGISEL